jgi:predicted O-linked N-acetylglucosamine transferase (SPINDLY family)
VWPLPGCFLCFEPPDIICPILEREKELGDPIIFGSFNNNIKNSSQVIDLWAQILRRVPNSRLMLKTAAFGDVLGRQLMIERFLAKGVTSGRLIFEGPGSRQEILASYNKIDIALDPMPYGGSVTTAEALWMGVPVVTLLGDLWVSRISAEMLKTLGITELIAETPEQYVEIAVALAKDKDRRKILHKTLRQQFGNSRLCDSKRFARDLEDAYRGMWQIWCQRQSGIGASLIGAKSCCRSKAWIVATCRSIQ